MVHLRARQFWRRFCDPNERTNTTNASALESESKLRLHCPSCSLAHEWELQESRRDGSADDLRESLSDRLSEKQMLMGRQVARSAGTGRPSRRRRPTFGTAMSIISWSSRADVGVRIPMITGE